MNHRQELQRKPSFIVLMAMIILTVMISNWAVYYFANKGEVLLSQITLVGSIAVGAIICGLLIYKTLAYYVYEIIDGKLFFERAIGKSNHIYFHIGKEDIIGIEKYEDAIKKQKKIKTFKFVLGNDKSQWYVVDFNKLSKPHRLIIHPDDNFKKGIDKWMAS